MPLSTKLLLAALPALAACQLPATGSTYVPDGTPGEILEQLLELSEPGPEHAALADLVGRFDAEVLTWSAPDEPPTRSLGSIDNSWILGGRYVMGRYRGEFLGQPFEGLSILGFDRARGVYIGTWADTASTWFLPFGSGRREGNAIVLEREMADATSGGRTLVRDVIRIDGPGRHSVTTYHVRRGLERRVMQVVYTRRP